MIGSWQCKFLKQVLFCVVCIAYCADVPLRNNSLILCCDARWRLSLPWVQMLRQNAGSRLSFSVQTREFSMGFRTCGWYGQSRVFQPWSLTNLVTGFEWWQGARSSCSQNFCPWNSEWADHFTCCATAFKYHALLHVSPLSNNWIRPTPDAANEPTA